MGLRLVVAVVDIDPAIALLCDFSFPEWRTGFEVVHNELGGIEGHAAMCASRPNENNFISGIYGANTVDRRNTL